MVKRLSQFRGVRYADIMLTVLALALCVIAVELDAIRRNGLAVNTQGSLELYEISRGIADAAENLEKISLSLEGMEREIVKLHPVFLRQHLEQRMP